METMTVEAFRAYRKNRDESRYLLIDVRQPVEYMDAHIPGAVLMPLKEFESRVDTLPDRDLIFYCRNGARSRAAALTADFFDETGRKSYNIEGGILAFEGKKVKDIPRLKAFDQLSGGVEILMFAMDMEKGACRFYSHVAENVSRPALKKTMHRLRDAETAHAVVIHSHLKDISPEVADFDTLYGGLSGETLEGGMDFAALVSSLETGQKDEELDILEMAVNLEYHAYDLYRFAAFRFADAGVETALDALAQAEKSHLDLLLDAIEDVVTNPEYETPCAGFGGRKKGTERILGKNR